MAGLVSPNIQKKIADTCVDEMIIMQVKYSKVQYFPNEFIVQGTHAHGRTG